MRWSRRGATWGDVLKQMRVTTVLLRAKLAIMNGENPMLMPVEDAELGTTPDRPAKGVSERGARPVGTSTEDGHESLQTEIDRLRDREAALAQQLAAVTRYDVYALETHRGETFYATTEVTSNPDGIWVRFDDVRAALAPHRSGRDEGGIDGD